MCRARHPIAALLASVVLLWLAAPARGASVTDPRYRFRTLTTEHFIIYFHQGEDHLARRLAVIAEDTWRALERPLGTTPPPLTHVVLADQADIANGWASPLPYDTISIVPAWPAGSDFIGHLDDWLRLVFVHEFTHIVHLDRSEGWARLVRGVFGRTPYAYPNLFLPTWQIEGLATYEESALTGEGRLHAGDFAAIAGEAARARKLEPLDRVNGGLIDWPGGQAAYAYGLGFHAFLSDRYGAEKLAELAKSTAGRVPYTASRVFARIYGRSLGDLWRDYRESVLAATPSAPPLDAAVRLTRHGFSVSGPRFTRSTCPTCPVEVVYSVRTPHDFPELRAIGIDGSSDRRLATRYLGSTSGADTGTVYFDQQEIRRNVGVYSDLYALDRSNGRVRRLTNEARLMDPDLSPDGSTIVAVQEKPGRRDLVLVRLNPEPAITTLLSEAETQFNAPRWSHNGRAIAVERHQLGGRSHVITVEPATGMTRLIASDPDRRWATPAWRPDDGAIVAAGNPDGGPFNLFEFDLNKSVAPRRLTHTTGGATWPDISQDGTTIVYVGYTVEGFDLFKMSYPATSDADAISDANEISDADPKIRVTYVARDFSRASDTGVQSPDSTSLVAPDYTPLPTLKPTWWSPIVENIAGSFRIGAATGGVDVLGYHAYNASATWLATSPLDAPAVSRSRPDWQVSYAYDRWRPSLFASLSRETSLFAGPPTDAGIPETATLRERQLQVGALVPVRRVRWSQTTLLTVVRATNDFTFVDRALSLNRTAARIGVAIDSARTYGYSISPERGVIAGLTAELVPRALGSSAHATAFTADARAYLPGFARHHVMALRVAGGTSSGDRTTRRTFDLGGSDPNLNTSSFGRNAIGLLRGFQSHTFAGRNVALVNAEYRFPIAYPQRGLGTWPAFLRAVHGAVFADAGHAWSRRFAAHDAKTSAGVELSIEAVASYSIPFTVTAGAAYGHDGSHTVSDRVTMYVRIGRAF